MTCLAWLDRLKEFTLDQLFPRLCIGCGQQGELLCQSCVAGLPRITPPLCAKCGLPLAANGVCLDCSRHGLTIDGIRSPFRFEGVVRQAIHHLKYGNLKLLARPLARLLSVYHETQALPGQVLVPVPLHPKRLRERGYNQAELLARELSQEIDLTLANLLYRRSATPPQARVASAQARQRNVAGAFGCCSRDLSATQVILIDDVCTTGATLDSCALALKEAGAASVWGLTIAREL